MVSSRGGGGSSHIIDDIASCEAPDVEVFMSGIHSELCKPRGRTVLADQDALCATWLSGVQGL